MRNTGFQTGIDTGIKRNACLKTAVFQTGMVLHTAGRFPSAGIAQALCHAVDGEVDEAQDVLVFRELVQFF